ncbi:hypothetical protein [Micromonospora sp. NPDC005367]|uniref:hypothetical protein n=1 Tax=Micromonospora sp. NPDC005367 TaxID=3155590 RepID=UPI0033ABAC6D
MSRRMVWVGCGRPATTRVEVYSAADGLLHGSLDASVYTCPQHVQGATAAVTAAGFTPYRGSAPVHLDRTCGYVFRFPTANGSTR